VDIPVTLQPLGLFPGGYNGALTLFNNDTADTVYVGETGPTCKQGSGLPLPPRASLQWDSGRPLWLSAPAGTPATPVIVSVVNNQGTIFSPADIASQIIAQGLTATAIAAAISVQGAPSIDSPIVLLNTSQNVATDVAPTDTGLLDVTRSTMVEVWATETGVTTPNTLWRHLILNWYSDLAGTDRIHGQHYYYPAYNGNQGVKVPVPGGARALKLTNTAATTVQTASLVYRIYGSTRTCTPSSWNGGSNVTSSGNVNIESAGFAGLFNMAGGAAGAGTITDYPQTYDGQAVFEGTALNVTVSALNMNLIDLVDNTTLAKLVFPVVAGVSFASFALIVPRRPLKCTVAAGGAYGGFGLSLMMTPW
jgi:hypothetical protein